MRRFVFLSVLIGLFCLLAASSVAQTSSGRHRSSDVVEEPASSPVDGNDTRNWYIMPGAGMMTSGDLIRVYTTGESGIPWDPPGGHPFISSDFVLTLDESIGLAVTLGRRLVDRLWLRFDFSVSQLPITALARVGETAEVYRWDELAVLLMNLSVEYRLVRYPSYFYLLGGSGLTSVGGNASDDYDQSLMNLRLGGGYNANLGRGWGLRLEIRDTLQSLDLAGYRPPVVVDPEEIYPDVQLEDRGPQHFVEILLSVNGSF